MTTHHDDSYYQRWHHGTPGNVEIVGWKLSNIEKGDRYEDVITWISSVGVKPILEGSIHWTTDWLPGDSFYIKRSTNLNVSHKIF